MNSNTETPNGVKSIALYDQRIVQSHADIMELFNSSKDRKTETDMKYKNKHDHIQNKEYIPYFNIKISWKENIIPTIHAVSGKKNIGSSIVI